MTKTSNLWAKKPIFKFSPLAKKSKLKYNLKLKESEVRESLKCRCFTKTSKGDKFGILQNIQRQQNKILELKTRGQQKGERM